MDRKKILIIGCGPIAAQLAMSLNKQAGVIVDIHNKQAETLLAVYKDIERKPFKVAEIFNKEKIEFDDLKTEIEKLVTASALSFDEVCSRLREFINREPIEFKINRIKFEDIKLVSEKLDNYRPGFYPDAKIEQFQDKNPGAKVGGRKHKKNPFRKGGNKW